MKTQKKRDPKRSKASATRRSAQTETKQQKASAVAQKRSEKAAAAAAAQAQTVAAAEFRVDGIPEFLRAAYAYEKKTLHPRPIVNSKFRVGDICEIERKRCVCFRVSDCCACFVALSSRAVSFDTVSGKAVAFIANTNDPIKVSANAEIDILERLGSEWRQKLFGRAQAHEGEETMSKKKTETAKSETAAAATDGAYVSLKGRSARVRELARKDKNFEKAWPKILSEFPGSSKGKVKKIFDSELSK